MTPEPSEPPEPQDPAHYELIKPKVAGSMAGRKVCLELNVQQDITAYELHIVTAILGGLVKGNVMACIIFEGVLRHFKEIDIPAEKSGDAGMEWSVWKQELEKRKEAVQQQAEKKAYFERLKQAAEAVDSDGMLDAVRHALQSTK